MRTLIRTILVVCALLFGSFAQAATEKDNVSLGKIQIRLFYKETGRLSEDLFSRQEPFVFFNTIIGEGDAEEAADDLLISIVLDSGKWEADNQKFLNEPVTLIAKSADGKIIAQRRFASVLTSHDGRETKALWLQDATCMGDVTITASFRNQLQRAQISMGCGE